MRNEQDPPLPKQREGLTLQPVGDELLVLDVQSDTLHQLNPSASYIFEQCDGHTSTQAIVEGLAHCYGMEPKKIEADVEQTLEQLRALRLIEWTA
jgi:methyltransferase-like protein